MLTPTIAHRGPAKHYIRSLETRLRLTEVLLRNLLSFISDDQLSYTLREDGPVKNSGDDLTLFEASGRVNSDIWQLYPLTDADNIRAWQRESNGFSENDNKRQQDLGLVHDITPQPHRLRYSRLEKRDIPSISRPEHVLERLPTNSPTSEQSEPINITDAETCSLSRTATDRTSVWDVDWNDYEMNTGLITANESLSHQEVHIRLDNNNNTSTVLIPLSFQKEFLW